VAKFTVCSGDAIATFLYKGGETTAGVGRELANANGRGPFVQEDGIRVTWMAGPPPYVVLRLVWLLCFAARGSLSLALHGLLREAAFISRFFFNYY